MDKPEHPMIDDPDAPPTEEEKIASERLRDALADPRIENADAELARALAQAHAPRELGKDEHDAIVRAALAKAKPRGRVIRITFGLATTLALAAAAVLVLGRFDMAKAPAADMSARASRAEPRAGALDARSVRRAVRQAALERRRQRADRSDRDGARQRLARKPVRHVGRPMSRFGTSDRGNLSLRSALALLFAALLALVLACAKARDAGEAPAPAQAADAGPVLDVEVMAFLSEARALHHEANIKEDDGDVPAAITVMNRLVGATLPHQGQRIPEVEEVLADAWARLAELHLKRHNLDEGNKAVKEGLAHAPNPTYFRGHLLEVEGILEETRATDLADAGKKDDAQKARARAIELLQEAVKVQEQVIGRALGDGGKR